MNLKRPMCGGLSVLLTIWVAGCGDAATTAEDIHSEAVTDAGAETVPASCAVEVGGVAVGDTVMDRTVRDCAGEEVSLRDFGCGAPLTLIDVGTAFMLRALRPRTPTPKTRTTRPSRQTG